MKRVPILLIGLFVLLIFAKTAEAKILPQAQTAKIGQSSSVGQTAVSGIRVFPKLRYDKRALIVNFANLQNATDVSYALTYNTSVQQEGVMGSLNLDGSSNTSQEFLFGTCSKNVCKYHTGISNMHLEVSYTARSGKKYIKRFRIRV